MEPEYRGGIAHGTCELGAALRQIQWLFSDGSATGASDTQLLGRFAAYRDEGAFAALMARHGPMVMTVCRGVLRDSIDAEDAFQATFLVLARKAGSAWAEGQLGGWLHRVAYRIAVRASIDAARRRAHERQAAEVATMESRTLIPMTSSSPRCMKSWRGCRRSCELPVVLCYLEGLTHAQAALQLRCGEATVRRRLAGARERLRNRLVRRGFAPAASALVLSITREARAVPAAVAEATLRAAVRVAAGEAMAVVAGARLAALTRAGLTIMTGSGKTAAACVIGRCDCVPGRWHRRLQWARAPPGSQVAVQAVVQTQPQPAVRAARPGRVGRSCEIIAETYNQRHGARPRRQACCRARKSSGSGIRGSSAAGWPGRKASKRSRRTERRRWPRAPPTPRAVSSSRQNSTPIAFSRTHGDRQGQGQWALRAELSSVRP